MTKEITLPDYQSKDAVFLVLLLKGHIIYIDNLPELVGFQDAPQRAYRLREIGIPIHDYKQALKPKYPKPVSFYYLEKEYIKGMQGNPRIKAFIELVTKTFSDIEEIKRGLQLKPQPLNSIIAGKL